MSDQLLVTTAQAARLACCEPYMIRKWAQRKILTPTSHDGFGRPLYTPSSVLEAERDTRVNTTRRGGRVRKIVLPRVTV